VSKYEAAVKYWNTHDYDCVKGRFIDGNKEGEYQRKVNEETKHWAKNHPHKYNLSRYEYIITVVKDKLIIYLTWRLYMMDGFTVLRIRTSR
jgi:hypothetical protein